MQLSIPTRIDPQPPAGGVAGKVPGAGTSFHAAMKMAATQGRPELRTRGRERRQGDGATKDATAERDGRLTQSDLPLNQGSQPTAPGNVTTGALGPEAVDSGDSPGSHAADSDSGVSRTAGLAVIRPDGTGLGQFGQSSVSGGSELAVDAGAGQDAEMDSSDQTMPVLAAAASPVLAARAVPAATPDTVSGAAEASGPEEVSAPGDSAQANPSQRAHETAITNMKPREAREVATPVRGSGARAPLNAEELLRLAKSLPQTPVSLPAAESVAAGTSPVRPTKAGRPEPATGNGLQGTVTAPNAHAGPQPAAHAGSGAGPVLPGLKDRAKRDNSPSDDSPNSNSDSDSGSENVGAAAATEGTAAAALTRATAHNADPGGAPAAAAAPVSTNGPGPTTAKAGEPAAEITLRNAALEGAGQHAEAGPMSGVQTAKLVQSLTESEMRVGMHSAEFGNISIRTSFAHQQISAQIVLDHDSLGRALSQHLPAMQERLGEEYGMRASVVIQNQTGSGYGTAGEGSREQRDPRGQQTSAQNPQGGSDPASAVAKEVAIATQKPVSSGRLSIRI